MGTVSFPGWHLSAYKKPAPARSPSASAKGLGGGCHRLPGAVRAVVVAGLLLVLPMRGALANDGLWELRIEGHQDFVFGEAGFGGGIRIPWEVVIGFEIGAGLYQLGSGTARWLEPAAPLSRPAGWFDCRQVDGSYLDSNLSLHETPRVRFPAFPVAGEVRGGRITLAPAYRPPGNYLAVTYRCETENPIASNWFAFAERGKQVMGKRQDAETGEDGERRSVRVREVASLPPESELDLPLSDGWQFSQGGADSDRAARYTLRRVGQ